MDIDDFRDDDALLAALKEALESARHPQDSLIMANARDAFSFSAMDEELASLVYDSLLESQLASAIRDGAETRTVVFESEALSMEIEIAGDTILGQIAPVGERSVTVEASDGTKTELVTDELGCFSIPVAAKGPLRFRIGQQGRSTVTEWTYLTS
jgi:hypothetical protein